jgi:hypothetical protein
MPSLVLAAAGCIEADPGSDRIRGAPFALAGAGDTPTWHEDVAPIVVGSCAECHHAGGIAPFPLVTYEDARPWAEVMAQATAARPKWPWRASAAR